MDRCADLARRRRLAGVPLRRARCAGAGAGAPARQGTGDFSRARLAGAVVLTKDEDFVELVRKRGPPPSILWLTAGNTSNARVRELLEKAWPRVEENLARGEALIELTERT